jgi:glycosyltransferase involved in cell wall biosynthesis
VSHNQANKATSVVIPTLNARAYLPKLISALKGQQPCPPTEILIVDSGSNDGTVEYVAGMGGEVRLLTIGLFSHGRARNLGVQNACGDYVVFMSQDAVPRDTVWLVELIAPFKNPQVAAAFSRQVPRPDANPMECFFLETHFPPGEPRLMRRNGHETLRFQRDVFFSNVSSAACRDILLRFPFDESLIMSEDQRFALDIIQAGLAVVYAPASIVRHSHDYSWIQVLRRYFDSVYSLTQIFDRHGVSCSARLGAAYLRQEFAMMIRRHPLYLPRYAAYVLAKTLGTVLGHAAERLPRWLVRQVSLHSYYWSPVRCATQGLSNPSTRRPR